MCRSRQAHDGVTGLGGSLFLRRRQRENCVRPGVCVIPNEHFFNQKGREGMAVAYMERSQYELSVVIFLMGLP